MGKEKEKEKRERERGSGHEIGAIEKRERERESSNFERTPYPQMISKDTYKGKSERKEKRGDR
eukprot:945314-Amorphochlora_amoeboformis.AAC.1